MLVYCYMAILLYWVLLCASMVPRRRIVWPIGQRDVFRGAKCRHIGGIGTPKTKLKYSKYWVMAQYRHLAIRVPK